MSELRAAGRLAGALSPYLLQHADSPVDWYPWGEEAITRAREQQRPIFLSIGYASCHWCHVMARESFADPHLAELINRYFLPVKVDREERPDLDAIYMQAVGYLTGHGGWPLTVFLNPQLEPFFGGTYYPPQDRDGRAGLRTVLLRVAEAWDQRRQELDAYAGQVVTRLRQQYRLAPRPGIPTADMLGRGLHAFANRFDREHGGFGRAPKFPPTSALPFLVRHYQRTGETYARHMAERTLAAMANGGLHDHLGGGFHRYATDREWQVPHFEKMLSDNALLASAYLQAHLAFGGDGYGQVAGRTLDYLLRETMVPGGGLACAQDADTEGEEGRYYTWTPQEIAAQLTPQEARAVMLHYGVTEQGNFEGRTVLHQTATSREVAAELRLPPAVAQQMLARARRRLLAARELRPAPFRDDKVLASWNGLAIGALALGYRALDEHRYLEAARAAANLVLTELMPGGELHHAYRAGQVAVPGLLEDFAYLAAGLLELHRADPDGPWQQHALGLMGQAAPLADSTGAYWDAPTAPDRIVRYQEGADGATPAPNAVAAQNLVALAQLTGDDSLRERAHRLLAAPSDPASCPTFVFTMAIS